MKSEQKTVQTVSKELSKDVEQDNLKSNKKGKEKDVKFYQKILSSTGLHRLSKSTSTTGVPKTTVFKEKLKQGHEEQTLTPVVSIII